MSNIDLNILRDQAYKIACDHGFHDKELSNEHFLCLVISELMEAVEADRKGKRFDKGKYEYNEITECQGWLTAEEKFINVFPLKDSYLFLSLRLSIYPNLVLPVLSPENGWHPHIHRSVFSASGLRELPHPHHSMDLSFR